MTRGCGCDGSLRAMRNRRLAAAASRNADSRKSMVAPVELMARLEVTPTALDSNICLINAPGFVGRLKMTPQSLFQFGTVSLHPTPDRRVIRLQTALGEQLFDIAQRQRVPEIPAHGTKNQLRRRLPPLEDCRSGCVLHGLFSLPASPAKVATHPSQQTAPSATESPISVSLPLNSRNRRVHGVSCDRSSPEKVESLKLCRRLGSVSLIALQAVTFATISLCRIFRSGAKDRGIPRNRVRDHVTEEKVSCAGQMRRLSQGSSRKAIGGSGALRIGAPSS